MKVYCFGNEFVGFDSVAKKLADELCLDGVEFVKVDSPEELSGRKVVILDVAEGINRIVVIDDLSKLKNSGACSCHDLDLAFYLKLKKELGELDEVKIVCVPVGYCFEKAKKEVVRVLKELVCQE